MKNEYKRTGEKLVKVRDGEQDLKGEPREGVEKSREERGKRKIKGSGSR